VLLTAPSASSASPSAPSSPPDTGGNPPYHRRQHHPHRHPPSAHPQADSDRVAATANTPAIERTARERTTEREWGRHTVASDHQADATPQPTRSHAPCSRTSGWFPASHTATPPLTHHSASRTHPPPPRAASGQRFPTRDWKSAGLLTAVQNKPLK